MKITSHPKTTKTLLHILVHFLETAQQEVWPAGSYLIFSFSDPAPVPTAPRHHLYSACSDARPQLHHFQLREQLLLTKAWEVVAVQRSNKEKPEFHPGVQNKATDTPLAHTLRALVTLCFLNFHLPHRPHSMMKNLQPHKIACLHSLVQTWAHCGSGAISFLIQAVEHLPLKEYFYLSYTFSVMRWVTKHSFCLLLLRASSVTV